MFSKLFRREPKAVGRPDDGPRRPATEDARAQAKANPGGWVYEIEGGYHPDEAIPHQAIRGAWKVDDRGEITGEYRPNPNFDPSFRKPAPGVG